MVQQSWLPGFGCHLWAQCSAMHICTSLCSAFSTRAPHLTVGTPWGSFKGDEEVSVKATVGVGKHRVSPETLCQKHACGRNKGKESKLQWSGCNLLSLRRKDSYLFGQSRVVFFYFLGKVNKQNKKKLKKPNKNPSICVMKKTTS